MIDKVISPISQKLWNGIGEDCLNHHHTFSVEYSKDKDKRLEKHVDDAEITVNYCLGTDFKGGVVRFEGMRCIMHNDTSFDKRTEQFSYENKPGHALIHLGRHFHLAEDIQEGER